MSSDRNAEHFQFTCLPHGSVIVKTQSFGFNNHFLFPFAQSLEGPSTFVRLSAPLTLRVYQQDSH